MTDRGFPMPTGATRVAGVIGSPVAHSLSPLLLNTAFAASGLDWVYLAFDVPAGRAREAIAGMRALGLAGLSVTMPHKDDAAAAVDELSDDAHLLGAVNCIVSTGGRAVGHNTDGAGFVWSVREAVPALDLDGATCVVLGAGGAGRAIALALCREGAEVVVVNRTRERSELAAALHPRVRVGEPADVTGAALVVNATAVGMGTGAADGGMPLDPGLLGSGQVVADIVYQPLVTPLLAAAEARGATPVGGVGMLVGQAALAFELWTGWPAPVNEMLAAVERALRERS